MDKGYVLLVALIMIGAAIASIDTQDIDELCSTNDKILKRQAGTWTCADDEGLNEVLFSGIDVAIYPEKTGWITLRDVANTTLTYLHAKGVYVSTFYEMSPNAKFLPAYYPWTDKYHKFDTTNDTWVFRVNKTNRIAFYGQSIDFHLKEINGDIVRYYGSDGTRLGRFAETSSGHTYYELFDTTGANSIRLQRS